MRALHVGIAVEAGLGTPADAGELARSPFAYQLVRALVEVDGGVEEARVIADLIPDGIPQLSHGYGELTWEVISAAATAGGRSGRRHIRALGVHQRERVRSAGQSAGAMRRVS